MDAKLTDEEQRTWQAFLRAHAGVTRRLDGDLLDEHGLRLGEYEVLLILAWAPDHSLRPSELAHRAVLSRSGVTRLVDRLERDGLVERLACPTDRRGALAHLTPAGREVLRRAARTHVRGIREYFSDRLSSAQLRQLGTSLGAIASELEGQPA